MTYVVCLLLLTVSSVRKYEAANDNPVGVHPAVSHAFLCTCEWVNDAALGSVKGVPGSLGSGDEIGRRLRSVLAPGWELVAY